MTLALDLGRSDLLVDAELARFADELPPAATRRRFLVTPSSLARATEAGLTSTSLSRWFLQRAGVGLPAAIRLLLHAASPRVGPLAVARPLILTVPAEDLLDGLFQHPDTGSCLGNRLGPTSAIIVESKWSTLQAALAALNLSFTDPATSIAEAAPPATSRLRRSPRNDAF